METIIEPQKEIPVLAEADVIVVGGGAAGIGSALAAARNGAKTILLEQANCLGGMQTQCLTPRFTELDPDIQGGIIEEIISRFKAEGAVYRGTTRSTHFGAFSFDPEYYKFLLDNMMAEAEVKLLYHAFGVGTVNEGNTIKGVIIESKQGRHIVLGKVVIDSTGSADIAWKSGAPVMEDGFPRGPGLGRHMGLGYAVTFKHVDTDKFRTFREANPEEWGTVIAGKSLIEGAKETGELYGNRGAFYVVPHLSPGSIWILGPQYSLPLGHHGWMLEDLSSGEIDLRKQAWSAYWLLKNHVPGFENAEIDQLPTHLLLRDTHRMEGEYVLKEEDMRQGRSFEDSIAISNHAPDLFGPDDQHEFIGNVPPYDIPYRSLVSRDIDNLLSAGASMSTDFITFAATRYCTPSICTGQAAGTAAALAAKSGVTPKQVDVDLLQATLRGQGAKVTVKDVPKSVLDEYQRIVEQAQRGSMGPEGSESIL